LLDKYLAVYAAAVENGTFIRSKASLITSIQVVGRRAE
jgi:hypothetical protein